MNKEGILKLMDHLDKPAYVVDESGYIQDVNKTYETLYQYKKDELVGKHFSLLVQGDKEFQIPLINDEEVVTHQKKYKAQRKDGSWFYTQNITYDYYFDGKKYRLFIHNFINEIKNEFTLALNGKALYLDLDEFKIFIDSYFQREDKEFTFLNLKFYFDVTNENADRYIKKDVKIFLRDTFKEESIIICPYKDFTYLVFIDKEYEVDRLKNKIENEFFYKFIREKQVFNNMFKLGILLSFNEDKFTFDSIYKKSEVARFFAKSNGYSFFFKEKVEKEKNKSSLAIELMNTKTFDEFVYFYQPLVDTRERIIGSECLMRWKSPVHGFISPEVFIPILEENGKILELEKRIIRKTIETIKLLERPFPYFSINLSGLHFRNWDFYNYIEELIEVEGFRTDGIIFEITETVLMQNLKFTGKILEKLKELGFKIAIDDFGVGYSSLIYLKELPVDILKIDRSFVTNIHQNKKNKAIVKYIISMAKTIGLKVICEGVETFDEMEELKTYNIDLLQGYYFSKPLSQKEYFEDILYKC